FDSLEAFKNTAKLAISMKGLHFQKKIATLLGVKENCSLLFCNAQKVKSGEIVEL
ncbi:16864_t:CDS:1, partial [Dentiscutata erythropus]